MILSGAVIVVLLSMCFVVVRVISGPSTYDRILAANAFGTKVVILIVLLSYIEGNTMLLDIALIYVLVNFITTIGFLKYFKYRSFGKE